MEREGNKVWRNSNSKVLSIHLNSGPFLQTKEWSPQNQVSLYIITPLTYIWSLLLLFSLLLSIYFLQICITLIHESSDFIINHVFIFPYVPTCPKLSRHSTLINFLDPFFIASDHIWVSLEKAIMCLMCLLGDVSETSRRRTTIRNHIKC